MNNFSKLLTDVLKKKKIPVYQLAKQCKIERSLLSRVLSGKRKLSADAFSRLIEQLSLSSTEEKELRQIYVNDHFGEAHYRKYFNFINSLSQFNENSASFDIQSPAIKINLNFPEKALAFSNILDTANVIDFVIDEELLKNTDTCRIYTNLNLKTIFRSLSKHVNKLPKNFDFKHLIPISRSKEFDLDTLFEAIRLMNLGCFSQYYNVDSTPEQHIDQLYPYFIITSDMTFFIGADLQNSFIIKDKDFSDKNAHLFAEKTKKTKQYVRAFNDVLECKENYKEIHSLGFDSFMAFGIFCGTLYMTKDMWEQIAKDDLPGREYLIKSTYEYYQSFADDYDNKAFIYSKESIDSFVETGIVKSIPTEYAEPLTTENRLRVLEKFRKDIEKNKNFILVKDGILKNLMDFSIEVFTKSDNEKLKHLSFAYQNNNAPMHFLGNMSCNIDEEKTINDFLEFTKYFAVSGTCYTHEESLKIIDDAIEKCRCTK